jgi:hypothetical protein
MSGRNLTKGGWLKNPKLPRHGETIGGGYFVFRRGDGTKRIRPSQWPFEYASFNEALEQAQKHAAEQPGYQFDIASVVGVACVTPNVADAIAEPLPRPDLGNGR